jgi:hypothetical protein
MPVHMAAVIRRPCVSTIAEVTLQVAWPGGAFALPASHISIFVYEISAVLTFSFGPQERANLFH